MWVVDTDDGYLGSTSAWLRESYIDSFNPDEEPCTQGLDVDGVPVLAGAQPGLVAVR